jgi:photosystem II PsbJ protein
LLRPPQKKSVLQTLDSVLPLNLEDKSVSEGGKIPLWLVATVAGTGVLVVVGLFFYGAYAGIGSSL